MKTYELHCKYCNTTRQVSKSQYFRALKQPDVRCFDCNKINADRKEKVKQALKRPEVLEKLRLSGVNNKGLVKGVFKQRKHKCITCGAEYPISRNGLWQINNKITSGECRSCSRNNKVNHQRISETTQVVFNQPEKRKNQREAALKWAKDNNVWSVPMFTPKAVAVIQELLEGYEELGVNWNVQYGANEFRWNGYFADAYVPEFNLWLEYDEPFHYDGNGNLKEKDKERMQYIIDTLNPSFWRYDEKREKLTKYN